jgi:hypothetical protein
MHLTFEALAMMIAITHLDTCILSTLEVTLA